MKLPPKAFYVIQIGVLVLVLVACAVLQSEATYFQSQIAIVQQQEQENHAATLGNRATGQENNQMLRAISTAVAAQVRK